MIEWTHAWKKITGKVNLTENAWNNFGQLILPRPTTGTLIFVVVFVAISFVICVSNRYKLNKNFLKLKAKSAAHYDDLALKTQCTQAQVGKWWFGSQDSMHSGPGW